MSKLKKGLATLLLLGSTLLCNAAPKIYETITKYDVNEDGLKDKIILENSGRKNDKQRYRVKVSYQRPDGSFTHPKTVFTERKSIKNLIVHDMDNDGGNDFVYIYFGKAVKIKYTDDNRFDSYKEIVFSERGKTKVHSMEIVDTKDGKIILYATRLKGRKNINRLKSYRTFGKEIDRMKRLTEEWLGREKINEYWSKKNKAHYITTKGKRGSADL